MRNASIWLFENPRRLRNMAVTVLVALIVLFGTSLALRLSGGNAGRCDHRCVAVATPTPVSTDLVAPDPEQTDVAPTQDYGDSTLIALEAVGAFIDHDLAKFDAIAHPEVAESVNVAPTPRTGQKITGDASITQPGPTQQTVHVPTTDGVLELVMVIDDGQWWVDSMKYVR